MKKIVKTGLRVGLILLVGFILGYAAKNHSVKNTQLAQAVQAAPAPPTAGELLKLVNAERAKVGVGPLVESIKLDLSAQYKASDMLNRNYYSHYDPITGKASFDVIYSTGIECSNSGENIAEHSSAKAAVEAWMNSKPHREAMLNPKNTLTGFGVAGLDKNGYYLFVEHFCQPR